jgi:anion-transporting  ArsA/GET3 family ATPase
MKLPLFSQRLLVVVGAGGVGKTTLAAALGLESARQGANTLVMTFDPSLRLKDALGVGESARERPVQVNADTTGRLDAALLDARQTFDRLIATYAPNSSAAERIYGNRFYRDLSGHLAGILEYMAVERLFEASRDRAYDRIILDTPPTGQALDFLEAPERMVDFLDSGAVRLAVEPWGDRARGIRGAPMRLVVRSAETMLDRIIGLGLVGEIVEFFRAFGPLYAGFRERADEVRSLLRDRETLFLLVSGPGPDRIPDTLYFARKLGETGHRLGPIVVNQVHPRFEGATGGPASEGGTLLRFLGERDHQGLAGLMALIRPPHRLVTMLLEPTPPTTIPALQRLGLALGTQLVQDP